MDAPIGSHRPAVNLVRVNMIGDFLRRVAPAAIIFQQVANVELRRNGHDAATGAKKQRGSPDGFRQIQ
jgi:hypothetical protein